MSKEQYDSLIKRISEIEQQKAILKVQVMECQRSLTDAQTELARLLCPFEIGEEVQMQRPFKGSTRAVVSAIVYGYSGYIRKKQGYSLHVAPLKKNGNRMNTLIKEEEAIEWYVHGPLSWDEFARLHGKEPISFAE